MKKLLVGCLFTSLVAFGQQTQKVEALDLETCSDKEINKIKEDTDRKGERENYTSTITNEDLMKQYATQMNY